MEKASKEKSQKYYLENKFLEMKIVKFFLN